MSSSPAQDVRTSNEEVAAASTQPQRKRVEYYAEESFKGASLIRTVHVGWGVAAGAALIMFCMGMSAATQNRSWNVSFLWLQRRVGAQFGTLSYLVTSNLLYYHDGDKWITRDWSAILDRWSSKPKKVAPPSFAASAVQQ
mmetsp:Transcript_12653/g.27385  ORF Transcript_12653/g.27385 Transcript_12653/m.27385 type:complete len:140 (-) Transcript_12653:792-1211(-)